MDRKTVNGAMANACCIDGNCDRQRRRPVTDIGQKNGQDRRCGRRMLSERYLYLKAEIVSWSETGWSPGPSLQETRLEAAIFGMAACCQSSIDVASGIRKRCLKGFRKLKRKRSQAEVSFPIPPFGQAGTTKHSPRTHSSSTMSRDRASPFNPSHVQDGVMSLPGLGLEEPEEIQKVETTQHELAKNSEWRFEVAAGKYVQVKVNTVRSHLPTKLTSLRFSLVLRSSSVPNSSFPIATSLPTPRLPSSHGRDAPSK